MFVLHFISAHFVSFRSILTLIGLIKTKNTKIKEREWNEYQLLYAAWWDVKFCVHQCQSLVVFDLQSEKIAKEQSKIVLKS